MFGMIEPFPIVHSQHGELFSLRARVKIVKRLSSVPEMKWWDVMR